jgi:hypothetical protein
MGNRYKLIKIQNARAINQQYKNLHQVDKKASFLFFRKTHPNKRLKMVDDSNVHGDWGFGNRRK